MKQKILVLASVSVLSVLVWSLLGINYWLHNEHLKPAIMLTSMMVASVSIVFFALQMVRSNGRNSALRQTLDQQRNIQQQLDSALAERDFVIRETQIGIWSWNVATGKVEVNEIWSKMLGYSLSEIDNRLSFWQERLHPDDQERVMAAVNNLLEGRTGHYRTDHRVRHRDGSWVWIRDVGAVYQRNQQGEPLIIKGIHININEIRTLCDELDQSRNELLQIVDRFLDSMIVVDSQLKISRVNEATASLLEFSAAELIGRYVGEIFVEPDLLIDSYFGFPHHPEHQDKQEWRNIELTLCTASGKRHPVSINISRLNDDSGRPTGVVAGAKDISSLKHALDKSRKQQKFISEILHILPGGVLVLSSGFDLQQRNQTFERLIEGWSATYGVDPHDLRHRVFAEISSRMDESGKNVPGSNVVYIPLAEAGLYIEIYVSRATTSHHAGRVVFLLDVTSREMLEQEKLLHSTVIRQISDGVIVTDLRGVIQYSNKSAQRICGYSLPELVGQRMSLFKSGHHDLTFYASLWNQLLAGNSWQGEIKNVSKEGKIFDISSSITPVRNTDGIITNYVSVWRDRTQELDLRRQLVNSQKFQAVGTLAAGIAHEINTPIQYVRHNVDFMKESFDQLVGILGNVNLLVDQCCTSENQEVCGAITEKMSGVDLEFLLKEVPESIGDSQKGICQITKIVTAMKEFCHPGKGSKKVSCDINQTIKNVVTITQNEWKYDATVELELDPDLPTIYCYPDAIQQVLLNLVVNSAQAISEQHGGGSEPLGRIDITTASINGSIRILVKDNGPGIPAKHQHQIFEPFFTTKEIGKGTGQGLAIAYDLIVNKHGGHIDYVALAGPGATFEIQLPIKEVASAMNS
ncbi:MAG: PAS domain S-box protein [Pelovirga sp.]